MIINGPTSRCRGPASITGSLPCPKTTNSLELDESTLQSVCGTEEKFPISSQSDNELIYFLVAYLGHPSRLKLPVFDADSYRRSVGGFSWGGYSQSPGFNPRQVHVGFLLDISAMEQDLPPILRFPLVSIAPLKLHDRSIACPLGLPT